MEIIEHFRESEALLEGHFLLSSGLHSDRYFQCARLLQYPARAEAVLRVVAEKVKNLGIDMVVGPAMGGITAAYELGRQLGVPAIFSERDAEGAMGLRRGFRIDDGMKVLIVEDVVTTGKSSLETAALIEAAGATVLGIGCLVDRMSSTIDLPIYSAMAVRVETHSPESCPLCKAGIPWVKPGSRKVTGGER